jgi:hypothetical protein
MAGLAGLIVLGLFLDGWNHINLQAGRLGSFFTPWHGLLYFGFAASTWWVLANNRHLLGAPTARPQFHVYGGRPLRFPFALFGVGVAVVGMAGDACWHTLFGPETGTARVIAPFHLLLFSGAALVLGAPLRSGWYNDEHYPRTVRLVRFAPVLGSITLLTAAIAFMFQWFDAFMEWEPALAVGRASPALADPAVRNAVEAASAARVVVTSIILMAPLLVLLRRWRLPFGSATVLFGAVAALMASLTEFRLGWTVLGAVVGGVAADVLIAALRPGPGRVLQHRLVAGIVPAATWTAYFGALRWGDHLAWPFDLWSGTVGLTVVTSVALSFLVIRRGPPVVWGDLAGASITSKQTATAVRS